MPTDPNHQIPPSESKYYGSNVKDFGMNVRSYNHGRTNVGKAHDLNSRDFLKQQTIQSGNSDSDEDNHLQLPDDDLEAANRLFNVPTNSNGVGIVVPNSGSSHPFGTNSSSVAVGSSHRYHGQSSNPNLRNDGVRNARRVSDESRPRDDFVDRRDDRHERRDDKLRIDRYDPPERRDDKLRVDRHDPPDIDRSRGQKDPSRGEVDRSRGEMDRSGAEVDRSRCEVDRRGTDDRHRTDHRHRLDHRARADDRQRQDRVDDRQRQDRRDDRPRPDERQRQERHEVDRRGTDDRPRPGDSSERRNPNDQVRTLNDLQGERRPDDRREDKRPDDRREDRRPDDRREDRHPDDRREDRRPDDRREDRRPDPKRDDRRDRPDERRDVRPDDRRDPRHDDRRQDPKHTRGGESHHDERREDRRPEERRNNDPRNASKSSRPEHSCRPQDRLPPTDPRRNAIMSRFPDDRPIMKSRSEKLPRDFRDREEIRQRRDDRMENRIRAPRDDKARDDRQLPRDDIVPPPRDDRNRVRDDDKNRLRDDRERPREDRPRDDRDKNREQKPRDDRPRDDRPREDKLASTREDELVHSREEQRRRDKADSTRRQEDARAKEFREENKQKEHLRGWEDIRMDPLAREEQIMAEEHRARDDRKLKESRQENRSREDKLSEHKLAHPLSHGREDKEFGREDRERRNLDDGKHPPRDDKQGSSRDDKHGFSRDDKQGFSRERELRQQRERKSWEARIGDHDLRKLQMDHGRMLDSLTNGGATSTLKRSSKDYSQDTPKPDSFVPPGRGISSKDGARDGMPYSRDGAREAGGPNLPPRDPSSKASDDLMGNRIRMENKRDVWKVGFRRAGTIDLNTVKQEHTSTRDEDIQNSRDPCDLQNSCNSKVRSNSLEKFHREGQSSSSRTVPNLKVLPHPEHMNADTTKGSAPQHQNGSSKTHGGSAKPDSSGSANSKSASASAANCSSASAAAGPPPNSFPHARASLQTTSVGMRNLREAQREGGVHRQFDDRPMRRSGSHIIARRNESEKRVDLRYEDFKRERRKDPSTNDRRDPKKDGQRDPKREDVREGDGRRDDPRLQEPRVDQRQTHTDQIRDFEKERPPPLDIKTTGQLDIRAHIPPSMPKENSDRPKDRQRDSGLNSRLISERYPERKSSTVQNKESIGTQNMSEEIQTMSEEIQTRETVNRIVSTGNDVDRGLSSGNDVNRGVSTASEKLNDVNRGVSAASEKAVVRVNETGNVTNKRVSRRTPTDEASPNITTETEADGMEKPSENPSIDRPALIGGVEFQESNDVKRAQSTPQLSNNSGKVSSANLSNASGTPQLATTGTTPDLQITPQLNNSIGNNSNGKSSNGATHSAELDKITPRSGSDQGSASKKIVRRSKSRVERSSKMEERISKIERRASPKSDRASELELDMLLELDAKNSSAAGENLESTRKTVEIQSSKAADDIREIRNSKGIDSRSSKPEIRTSKVDHLRTSLVENMRTSHKVDPKLVKTEPKISDSDPLTKSEASTVDTARKDNGGKIDNETVGILRTEGPSSKTDGSKTEKSVSIVGATKRANGATSVEARENRSSPASKSNVAGPPAKMPIGNKVVASHNPRFLSILKNNNNLTAANTNPNQLQTLPNLTGLTPNEAGLTPTKKTSEEKKTATFDKKTTNFLSVTPDNGGTRADSGFNRALATSRRGRRSSQWKHDARLEKSKLICDLFQKYIAEQEFTETISLYQKIVNTICKWDVHASINGPNSRSNNGSKDSAFSTGSKGSSIGSAFSSSKESNVSESKSNVGLEEISFTNADLMYLHARNTVSKKRQSRRLSQASSQTPSTPGNAAMMGNNAMMAAPPSIIVAAPPANNKSGGSNSGTSNNLSGLSGTKSSTTKPIVGGRNPGFFFPYYAIRRASSLSQNWKCKKIFENLDELPRRRIKDRKKIVIIGAGPVGLRLAIELQLGGHQAVVLEKRATFSRINRLHLWSWVRRDVERHSGRSFLTSAQQGPVFSDADFCHLGIDELQRLLLKNALLLGVEVNVDVEYQSSMVKMTTDPDVVKTISTLYPRPQDVLETAGLNQNMHQQRVDLNASIIDLNASMSSMIHGHQPCSGHLNDSLMMSSASVIAIGGTSIIVKNNESMARNSETKNAIITGDSSITLGGETAATASTTPTASSPNDDTKGDTTAEETGKGDTTTENSSSEIDSSKDDLPISKGSHAANENEIHHEREPKFGPFLMSFVGPFAGGTWASPVSVVATKYASQQRYYANQNSTIPGNLNHIWEIKCKVPIENAPPVENIPGSTTVEIKDTNSLQKIENEKTGENTDKKTVNKSPEAGDKVPDVTSFNQSAKSKKETVQRLLYADVLIGADGPRSLVAKDHGRYLGERITADFSEAIGVVCNLKRSACHPGTNNTRQFSWARQFNVSMFAQIEKKTKLSLENMVYYRGPEFHYLIMTPTRASLSNIGINLGPPREPANWKSLLKPVVLQLLAFLGFEHLTEDAFVQTTGLDQDLMLFDFSSTMRAANSVAYNPYMDPSHYSSVENQLFTYYRDPSSVHNNKSNRVTTTGYQPHTDKTNNPCPLIGLVGDALLEPFWPEGLGIIRGFLSALDFAWVADNIPNRSVQNYQSEDNNVIRRFDEILEKAGRAWKILKCVNGKMRANYLKDDEAKYAVDPTTRYRAL